MSLTTSVTYDDFPDLTPAENNKAVGIVKADGNIYCRPCVDRLGISFDGTKYITDLYSRKYIFNCCECGWKISRKRAKMKV